MSGNSCSSYSSTSNGTGTVTNLPSTPGFAVHFRVTFTGVSQQFVIKANPSGDNYTGHANNGQKRTDETWAATATAEPAANAKAY
jgi:hypothetical protein